MENLVVELGLLHEFEVVDVVENILLILFGRFRLAGCSGTAVDRVPILLGD